MAQASTQFSNVIMFEQAKSLRSLKELSEKVDSSKKSSEETKSTKVVETLNDNLKTLAQKIEDQTKITIRNAIKGGAGAEKAEQINSKDVKLARGEDGKGSRLRKILLGGDQTEDIKKNNWMGKYSPGMAVSGWLDKREQKQAYKKEEGDFVKGAIQNDPRAIALKNLKGEEYAAEDAKKRFAELKEKEKELTEAQKRIDESKAAGYAPKVKDIEARDKATKKIMEIDPREQSRLKADAKKEIQEGKVTKEPKHTEKTEDQQEDSRIQAQSASEMINLQKGEAANETTMGQTLIQSLEVQKQTLEAIKAGGTGGGEGGSLLDTAADLMGKGKGKLAKAGPMLGKAAGFLGRHAGKIGAIGGVAMGAYDAYTGWGDANEQLAAGKITEDQANVKKAEAVGGGTGGAAGALGGAAAGAAIGSVVPVVGTAIGGLVGGALGYWGGSEIGKKAGGALTEGYQGAKKWLGFGGDEKKDEGVKPQVTKASMETLADEPVQKGKPLSPNQMAVANMSMKMGNKLSPLAQEAYDLAKKQPMSEVVAKPVTDSPITNASKNNEDLKAASASGKKPEETKTVLNTSNNVVNNNTTQAARKSVRSDEPSSNRYFNSRYA
jgi:hypothetical protein